MEFLWPSECGGCGVAGKGLLCPACRTKVSTIPLGIASLPDGFASFEYRSPLGVALRRAKVAADQQLFGAVIRSAVPSLVGQIPTSFVPEAVAYVPSPWARTFVRGFMPGAAVAREVARRCKLPVVRSLSMARGRKQAKRGVQSRGSVASRLGLKGAMPKKMLLVDDVWTTGSTALACRQLLRRHGNEHCLILTLARSSLG